MANRYWVGGGNGDWNSTTNWSATTGGASGASVPGSADTAALDANSGSGTVTLDISPTIQTLTCTGFTGTLAFGTNNINLNGTGTIFTGATTMTVTGTPAILCSDSTGATRTITPDAVTEANSISFYVLGFGSFVITTNAAVRSLDFANYLGGFSGTLTNTLLTVYGNFYLRSGMSVTSGATRTITFASTSFFNTISTTGVSLDVPLVFNGVGGTWQLLSDITDSTLASTITCTLTNGTLDLNNFSLKTGLFSISATNATTLAFGTGNLYLTGIGTPFTGSATCTVTGVPQVIFDNTSSSTRTISPGVVTEANSISFQFINGAGSISLTTGHAFRNLDFTDGSNPTGSSGPLLSTSPTIYGNLKLSTNMTVTAGTTTLRFAATSGTKNIDFANLTADRNFTFDGVGGEWQLQSALSAGTAKTLTLTNGTLTTNGYAITTGLIASSNTNTRTLNLGASTVTLTGTGTPWNFLTTTGLTFNAGTSLIVTTATSGNIAFASGGLTYNDVTFGATYRNIGFSGNSTLNNLTIASPAGLGRRSFSVSATYITVLGTLSCSGAAANRRPRITSGALGLTFNVASVAPLSDVDFLGITAVGASAPWSGTRLGDMGQSNVNIIFDAPKTVYWNQPAGGNWSDAAWATASGGTVDINNFPLSQDTVILDNTGVGAASTIVMDYGWVMGTVNASALTNAMTLNWNCFGNLGATLMGSWTLSSAITVTYTTGSLSIATLQSVATITTAGVAFPIPSCNFNSVGKTFVLADNFTVTGASAGLVAGTLNLNGKTFTCVSFDATFTDLEVRAIAFNGGQFNVTGNAATVWACEDLTNFSYTGTPTVNLTYSGSTGTRVIAHGSTAGGTEANAVDFNIVAGGDTVNFTAGATGSKGRNLSYQPAFTGTSEIMSGSFIYGNFLLSPSMTVSSGTSGPIFAATFGTKTITTNSVTIDRPITFNGIGGTWAMQDALTLGSTRSLTMVNGTLQLKAGTTNTVGAFATSGNSQKYLQSTTAGVQATLSDASGTNDVSYLSIKDSNATGGAVWSAPYSQVNLNGGNNTGWNFGAPVLLTKGNRTSFGLCFRI